MMMHSQLKSPEARKDRVHKSISWRLQVRYVGRHATGWGAESF
jgi:hypothetical protein